MFKRIGLFFITNLMIMAMIGIITTVTGANRFVTAYGLDLGRLFVYAAIIGFTGALISLAISRWSAKMMLGVRVIDSMSAQTSEEEWLVKTVHFYAQQAGMKVMPEVGIYDSPEVNAFATGPTKNMALVAVSTGLFDNMAHEAIEGVIGHEISHVVNGDMVTMTLMQGVINTFVEFLSRVIGWAASRFLSRDEDEAPNHLVYFGVYMVMQIVLGILGTMVVMAFSRYREYKADKGGADLAGKENMIRALESLKRIHGEPDPRGASLSSFKISGGSNFMKLFSSHPDLDDRIAKLNEL